MRIAILGGRGFIGSAIVRGLSDNYVFFIVKPELQNFLDELNDFKPDTIINACASLPSASEIDSRLGNFDYPLSIFEFISEKFTYSFTWIQIASYYELELPLGRSDPYTRHKFEFRNLLEAECRTKNKIFRTLMLPHVVGRGERPNRLVGTAIKSIRENLKLNLEHPNVMLPILIIDDVIRALAEFLKNDQSIAFAIPVWYDSNKKLIQEINQCLGNEVLNSDFESGASIEIEKITFPPKVHGWIPQVTLEEYIRTF
jgi:nucleoside-diphosphate-sugar epimerase